VYKLLNDSAGIPIFRVRFTMVAALCIRLLPGNVIAPPMAYSFIYMLHDISQLIF